MPWRHVGEWKYSSIIFDFDTRRRLVFSFTPRPVYLREKSPRFSFYMSWVGPQLVWTLFRREKSLALTGNRTPAFQHIARHYTDWAIPAHKTTCHRRGSLAGHECYCLRTLSSHSEDWGAHIATLGLLLTGLAGTGMTLSAHYFRGSASKPLAHEY
jgi:hypothetical protein